MAGTLHLACGKIAAGKSTHCARLAATPGTVLIAEECVQLVREGDAGSAQ